MTGARRVESVRIASVETVTCVECGWTCSGEAAVIAGNAHVGSFGHDVVASFLTLRTLTLMPEPTPAVES